MKVIKYLQDECDKIFTSLLFLFHHLYLNSYLESKICDLFPSLHKVIVISAA